MKIISCTGLSFLIYKMGVLMLSIKSGLRIKILVCGKALHGYEIPEKRTMFILRGSTKELEKNEGWRWIPLESGKSSWGGL